MKRIIIVMALLGVFITLIIENSLAQEVSKPTPVIPPELLFKDFDVVKTSLDANGFPLNPKWGQQVRDNTIPSPTDSCPVDDSDTLHWTSSPQWPNCTSFPVTFNWSPWCSRHVNFMPVTYEGRVTWGGTGEANWFPFGDSDYTLNVERDDDALYSTAGSQVHIEFDSRETVDQWDGTDTWWQKFHHDGVDKGDDEAHRMIDTHFAIVIGLLGLDTYQGPGHGTATHGKTELHPVYAMFVRTDQRFKFTHSWAFFVRNWGNEGYCGASDMKLNRKVIKVQIPHAAKLVAVNGRMGARNADINEVESSMNFSAQPNGDGIELTFTLLGSDKQSWIMGDLTFERPLPVLEPPRRRSPQFEAIQAQIDKLPKSARKKLFAQQRR
jgi:hypothetical protein